MYNNINNKNFKKLIVGAYCKVPICNGTSTYYINFDNAATTPAFLAVMDKLNKFAPWYSSIHRGTGYKSKLSTDMYNLCRTVVANFVKADLSKDEVLFVKNTTEGINKLSYLLKGDKSNEDKDIVLCTFMEHHSNDLPWRNKFNVIYINVDQYGKLCMDDLEAKLKKYSGRIKLVAVSGASNVTGYINPVHQIASLAHENGAKILVDGAQLIPHVPFTMKPHDSSSHIDFLAFSAHKMYAPFGCGVLIGPKDFFNNNISEQVGGGTIKIVTPEEIAWADSPDNQEAGTPNLMGALALCASIDVLNSIGMDVIYKHEDTLKKYALSKLYTIEDVKIYCKKDDYQNTVSIIPFNINGLYHGNVARALSEHWGIGVRSGCFCAHPYVERLLNVPKDEIEYMMRNPDNPKKGLVRISFGLYNTLQEIDIFVNAIKYIVKNKQKFKISDE
ncbi:aminotransferase class V-fold PLP-dependent enzyme [Haloimpatiens massiliensis]|uniref:aminotransferase class V-fold PLP-dependent enzyme n=1 Tax=Haloimpatiens massiliensis TaxID=1658110 RepID=UPI000C8294E4|nr:aminotransferase class V-fold PLP-dependent enzyme [Haloimpatiens massiliensis]